MWAPLLVLFAGAAMAAESPLDAAARAIASMPTDPAGTNNGTHYVVSNERRLDLFAHQLPTRVGGVLVGVGAEQVLVLAGWTRPELVVALDFDPVIVDLHRVHAAFLRRASSPEAFVALWAGGGTSEALLGAGPIDAAARERLLEVFRSAAPAVVARLQELRQRPWRGRGTQRVATFVSDSEQYDVVRALALAGRLVPLGADLTGHVAMPALTRQLSAEGLMVRTLYLSNAEQYFMYGPGYRRNMLALPMDEATVVLRTLPGRPRDYEYLSQPGLDFQDWLRDGRCRSVYRIRGLVRGAHLAGETSHRLGPPPR